MNDLNYKKLDGYIAKFKRDNYINDFDPVDEDDYKKQPKPQYWSQIDSLSFDPDRWLIPNLLPKEGITMVASISGEGKTLLILHLSKCLADGSPLFGNPNFPVKKSKVLYINLEMSTSEVQRRGRLIGFKSEETNLIILNEDDFNLNAGSRMDFKYLWLLEFTLRENIEVIIIDTVRPTIGNMREDKAEEVRSFFQKFFILKNSGVSLVFTEHLRKPTQMEGRIPKKEQVLGSQDKVSNLEVLLMIRKDELTGETHIYQRKNRLGNEEKPFAIKITDGIDSDNKKILNFDYIGQIEDNVNKKEEAKELILNILSSGERKTTNQILELVKKDVGQKNARRALREMQIQEEVSVTKDGKQNVYSLPKEEEKNTSKIELHNETADIFDTF